MPSESFIRGQVAALINRIGLQAAVSQLGIGEESVLRIAAGASVRRGSIAAAAIALGLAGEQPGVVPVSISTSPLNNAR